MAASRPTHDHNHNHMALLSDEDIKDFLMDLDSFGDCLQEMNDNYISIRFQSNAANRMDDDDDSDSDSNNSNNMDNSHVCSGKHQHIGDCYESMVSVSDEEDTLIDLKTFMNDTQFYEEIFAMEQEALQHGCNTDIRNVPARLIDSTAPTIDVDDLLHILDNTNDAVVITEACSPFRVKFVNKAWEDLCEYSSQEIVGKSLALIQGPDTDLGELQRLKHHAHRSNGFQATLKNYKKSGKSFLNSLQIIHSKDLHGYSGNSFLLGYLREI